jgi:hypothetical protein
MEVLFVAIGARRNDDNGSNTNSGYVRIFGHK